MQLEIEHIKQMDQAFEREHRLTGMQLLERLKQPATHAKLIALAKSLKPWGIQPALIRATIDGKRYCGRFYERTHFREVIKTERPRNPRRDYTGTIIQLQRLLVARDAQLDMHRREKKAAYAQATKINRIMMQYLNRAVTAEHAAALLREEVAMLRGEEVAREKPRGTVDMVLHL